MPGFAELPGFSVSETGMMSLRISSKTELADGAQFAGLALDEFGKNPAMPIINAKTAIMVRMRFMAGPLK